MVAARCIEKLVSAGVLQEVTGYARNPVFHVDEIFRALDDSG